MSKQVVIRGRGRDRTIPARSPMCGRTKHIQGDPLQGMAAVSEMKLSYGKACRTGL